MQKNELFEAVIVDNRNIKILVYLLHVVGLFEAVNVENTNIKILVYLLHVGWCVYSYFVCFRWLSVYWQTVYT